MSQIRLLGYFLGLSVAYGLALTALCSGFWLYLLICVSFCALRLTPPIFFLMVCESHGLYLWAFRFVLSLIYIYGVGFWSLVVVL